jgi:hypothetical protein
VLSAPIRAIILGMRASVFLRRDGESAVTRRPAPGPRASDRERWLRGMRRMQARLAGKAG